MLVGVVALGLFGWFLHLEPGDDAYSSVFRSHPVRSSLLLLTPWVAIAAGATQELPIVVAGILVALFVALINWVASRSDAQRPSAAAMSIVLGIGLALASFVYLGW